MQNITRKLLAVAKEVSYLQKDKSAALRYSFVSHDKVTAALRGPLIDQGVYYNVDVVDSSVEIYQSADGKPNFLSQVKVAVTFFDTESGEQLTMHGVGMGLDPSDKSVGKAVSYAVKYALLKSFGLETGDDPETDNHTVGKQITKSPASMASERGQQPAARDLEKLGQYTKPKPATEESYITGQQQRYIWAWGTSGPEKNGLGLTREDIDAVLIQGGFKDKDTGRAKISIVPSSEFDTLKNALVRHKELKG
jgi:hypothetical protein